MKTELINGNGDFRHVASQLCIVDIRTTAEFHVVINDKLVGPNSSNSRHIRKTLQKDDELDVFCSERYTIQIITVPPRGERLDPESMVEVIEEGELSMYEQLRQEMLGKLSQIAKANDYDTPEEDESLEWDEDDDTPLTPYEYTEMQLEEFEQPLEPETLPEVTKTETPSPTMEKQPEATSSD